jgi:monoamine oxidase
MSAVVVGAGPAGLAAARKLQRSGVDVIVLEAKPYVGGRTRSDRQRLLHGEPADLGASFIDIGQDKILEVCAELGVALTPSFGLFRPDPDGRLTAASILRTIMVIGGRRATDAERDEIADELRAALDSAPPDPTEMIPAWAARAGLSPVTRRMFCLQTGANPVHHASQVQMAMLHPPHIGRTCWLLADGSDSLATAMAAGLDVRLSSPVRRVSSRGGIVVIETDNDQNEAQDVVIATPVTPTLRIGFDPVLPAWKTNALLATPMTQGGKVIGQYRNGHEIVRRLPSSAISDGPIPYIWTRPPGPEDTVAVLGLAADTGDGFLRNEERGLETLDTLLAAATGLAVERVAGVLQDWTSDEYAGGVVSYLLGDSPRQGNLLAQSVGRMHFAGEHTAEMWSTSMDGALRSGERAADEVLQGRELTMAQDALTTTP